MTRILSAAILALAGLTGTGAAWAGDDFLKFDGAIGVDPVGGFTSITIGTTTFDAITRNTVLGVPPGGRPWVLRKFKARIGADGQVVARGSGLLFGGGDLIGTRGGVTQVALTLFCSGIAHHTAPVPLDTNGNFTVKDTLLSPPPNPCNSPVLLVRNANNGVLGGWFAAGVLDTED
ncbi:MAG: hypothetical protein RLZZ584_435 [Pseudomonadota bacterium]